MWVLCGPSLVWGLDLSVRSICDTVCLSPPCPFVFSRVAVSPGSLTWLLCGPTFYPFTHPCVLFVIFAVCFGLAEISYIVVPCILVCAVDGVLCSVCQNILQHDGLLFERLPLYIE